MRILVTGANGFLGSHLVRVCAERGHEVIAAYRKGANLSKLDETICSTTVLNYRTIDTLADQLRNIQSTYGRLDIILHNAALTHSINAQQFYEVNVNLTQNLCQAIHKAGIFNMGGKFALISSMAALGPVGFNQPVSHYGKSKMKAEAVVKSFSFDYLIFRPTAIYGPGDNSFKPLFKSVRLKLYPRFNPAGQKITMIHGEDVARNVEKFVTNLKNLTIHLDDLQVYSHKELARITGETVNRQPVTIPIPWFIARSIFGLITFFCKVLQITPPITSEKHFEISRDWNHDFSEERKNNPLEIKYSLKAGFQETYRYYKANKLL